MALRTSIAAGVGQYSNQQGNETGASNDWAKAKAILRVVSDVRIQKTDRYGSENATGRVVYATISAA